MVKTKVIKWTCPKCKKVIESLYPNQLAFNKGIHEATCKLNNNPETSEKKLREVKR